MPINMGHCRFRNTLEALRECDMALQERGLPDDKDELDAMRELLVLCLVMVRAYSKLDD